MFFPDFLYRLSQRDQQVTWLDPVFAHPPAVSQPAATVEATYQVPDGRILMLQSVSNQADPGGAQTTDEMRIGVRAPSMAPGEVIFLAAKHSGVATVADNLNWSGSVAVPPGWLVVARNIYSAAAIANNTDLHVAGILIPVGNVQRL